LLLLLPLLLLLRCHYKLRHAAVWPDSTDIISDIQKLQPVSMSWSNVPDYMGAQVGLSPLKPKCQLLFYKILHPNNINHS
jgi:hypothetical protein